MAVLAGPLKIQTLDDLELNEKSVLCRVDLNVPLEEKRVVDDTRIQAILPTVNDLLDKNSKLVLMSHLGRPKGKVVEKYSLMPVAEHLAELLHKEVIFPDDCVGDGVRKIFREQKNREVILLENLRFHRGEEINDPKFAKALKGAFEVYINDAFGTLHRAHASTSAVPQLFEKRAAGRLVIRELEALNSLLHAPQHPYAIVLGGAKISDKVKTIELLLRKVDFLFLGGAMVFTFLKAMGYTVGNSLVEEGMIHRVQAMLDDAKNRGVKIILPKDFKLGRSIENPGSPQVIEELNIPEGWMGLDVGPKTVNYYGELLKEVKTIFWNGPLGLFEKPPFDQGTLGFAHLLSKLPMTRVIGGGDSAAAVQKAGVVQEMTHISTGGGATLEFLQGKALPGLQALSV